MSGVSIKNRAAGKPQKTMRTPGIPFHRVACSLNDLLGREYMDEVCAARAFLTGESKDALAALAQEEVDLFPASFQERLLRLLPNVGNLCCSPASRGTQGATSDAFRASSAPDSAPRSCLGYFRLCEDGRLFFTSKSAHYHTPLGHGFPGYALIEHAKRLGIPNATHNNARGHITRLTEEKLVCRAAGLPREDDGRLSRLMASSQPEDLNRVLNLQTGSLAAEAALKMVLSRFFKVQAGAAPPKYAGRTPVLVVMGDEDGAIQANYHGTTVLTQVMRGMWPEFLENMEKNGLLAVRAVRPNDVNGLNAAFRAYEQPPFKIAGLFLELIMMNYGGKRLSDAFVQRAAALCLEHDVPSVVDEIQTCIWSPETFMFREYGIKPAIVVLGKGFPGGEYAASRVLFNAAMDTLPQFGALVTNGQEELAALAYLITLHWATANAEVIRTIGDYYENRLQTLAQQYPGLITKIDGKRHLAGVYFKNLDTAKSFVSRLQAAGLDISVQAYKEGCPPSALTKLPLIVGVEAVDCVIAKMEEALAAL